MSRQWEIEVKKKPKLRSYVKFKDTICKEPYITSRLSRSARSLFAQFRLGILPLKLETDIFKKLNVEDRICELCHTGSVEDEIHFLCTCPLYSDFRNKLFLKGLTIVHDFMNLDDESKFIILIKFCWKDVSQFIYSSWNLRKSKLYN